METSLDMAFGFNDSNFSDRTLCIAILPDDHDKTSSGPKPDEPEDSRKPVCDEQLQVSTDMYAGESSKNETSCDQLNKFAFEEKVISVNSLILAAHSPFFHKLFSNGMKESGQQQATIHIQALEEAAFMEMLKFMYSGKLPSATPAELVQLLKVADKFSAASCVNLCCRLLNTLPMTLEMALLYLDLDSAGLMVDSVKKSLDKAKKFLPEHFKDMTGDMFKEELLMLPLAGVKAVLSSDCLQIDSEDKIYDLISMWVQNHYPDEVEEKRKMLNMLLRRYFRSPYVSSRKLLEIMSSGDVDHDVALKLPVNSLSYHQVQFSEKQRRKLIIKRAYKRPPVKAVAFDELSIRPQFIVYLDIKAEECNKLLLDEFIMAQDFFLGKHTMTLSFHKKIGGFFELDFAARTRDVSETAALDFSCEIAFMRESSGDFFVMHKENVKINNGERICLYNMFPQFINNIFRLRFHFAIKGSLFK